MTEWWNALTGVEQTLWGISLFATGLFLIQTFFTLIGLADFGESLEAFEDMGSDAGDGDDGVFGGMWEYFTVRNAINFLLGFSWGTLMFKEWGIWTFFSMIGGIGLGLGLVALMGMLMATLLRFESGGGDVPLERTIGEEGNVVIRIPANGSGYGKVGITYADRYREIEAISKGSELRRGDRVIVTNVEGSQIVVRPTERQNFLNY